MAPYLLNLPRELGDKIYKNILVADNMLRAEPPESATETRLANETKDAVPTETQAEDYARLMDTRLLAVNHQIHAEAIEIFHEQNEFGFRYPTDRTETMKNALRLRILNIPLGTNNEARDVVAAVKSCNTNATSLYISISIPWVWALRFYGPKSEQLQIFKGLLEENFKGKIAIGLTVLNRGGGVRDPCWDEEMCLENGLGNLCKVMSGEVEAKNLKWPKAKPRDIRLWTTDESESEAINDVRTDEDDNSEYEVVRDEEKDVDDDKSGREDEEE